MSTTWRSSARRILVVLEVAFAESRPSTFSVDAVGVRGVDICSPFRLSYPFGYPAGSLETGSFFPQYRPGFRQAVSLLPLWSCDPRSGSLSRNAGPRRKMTDFGAGLPVGLNQVVLGLKVEPELRIAAEPVTEA